ncbi:MAG: hypothetical protein HKN73_16175, partial [Gemmatimonadetes bacterium]|nr:hypothetical protein [Gemmatimonadota bacterium]
MRKHFVAQSAAAAALAFLLVGPAVAQTGSSNWQPFLGCWETEEQEGEGALCFVPSGSQVEMVTVADGSIEYREYFAADGVTRNIDQEGCLGTESARFSADGGRIFTTSDLECEDGPRQSSGIISMVGTGEWVDVRALDGEDGPVAWVQRYYRIDADILEDVGLENPDRQSAFRGRAVRAAGGMSTDDVLEATDAVGDAAVQAWLGETGMGIDRLNADDLIALDDAGVSEDVIDMLVAVSYPERFAVARDDGRDRGGYARRAGRPIWLGGFYSPFYRYGYSPYAYGYGYGYYGYPGYVYGYAPIRIDRGGIRGAAGRVIAGQGYSRGGQSGRGTARASG